MTRKRPPTDPPDDAEPEKKERVIHTRVPESLEAELRERAQGLGISVSNLVRNVLGHAFGLVGDVFADTHAIARAARGETKKAGVTSTPPAAASIDDVLGWQTIVLGKNAVCARCNAILPRGKPAAVGAGTQLVVCPPCLEELTR
ncbi:MAG: hypothetical protein H0T42_23715 [Deltaproteobacteria bacterium]|nr:hypothetical protein [Deltaproteobacteria bacterium]